MLAARAGQLCIALAAQINAITVRHCFARRLPFDLSAHLPNAFPELNDHELIEHLRSATQHNSLTGHHPDVFNSLALSEEIRRRRKSAR